MFIIEKKWIFSILAGSIWFVLRFELNIFTSKISNLLLPLGFEGSGAVTLEMAIETYNYYLRKKMCT